MCWTPDVIRSNIGPPNSHRHIHLHCFAQSRNLRALPWMSPCLLNGHVGYQSLPVVLVFQTSPFL
ncbi:hypothetical protein BDN67DRAFT_685639 [Paxillus ammoniavirescens]|nr:hypothetical protein BDN67DRAFT_685639 [Paxillus ammoniavirescens]